MTTPTKSSTVSSTQPLAVPLADKSAARKPIIIAILTIVLLVGITLSLFFLQIRTAGKAIAVGEAKVGEAGIFLTEKTIEVGQQFKVPIKANLGSEKSVSFKFKLTLDDKLTSGGFDYTALNKFISVDGEDVSIVKKVECELASGEVVFCGADSKSISVEVGWLCTDESCSNALKGNDVVLGEISLISKEKGPGKLTFSEFDVYKLGTSDDLINGDGKGVDIEVTEKEQVCSATNLAVCIVATCQQEQLYWYDNACHIEEQKKPAGCTNDNGCAAGEVCTVGKCVAKQPECDDQHLNLCETSEKCKTEHLNWNAYSILGTVGCYKDCPVKSVEDVDSNCVSDEDEDKVPDSTDNCPNKANSDQTDGDKDGTGDACDTEVCDREHPYLCTTQPLCSAANNLWYKDQCIFETSCPKDARVGDELAADGVTKYRTCILTPEGSEKCTKDNLAVCTVVTCPAQGLLWDAVKTTCSVCLVGEELNKEKTACVKVIPKKVSIELEDSKGLTVAKEAKLKKEKHKVKVTIHPDIEFPENHIVLVKVKYEKEALPKTIFADKKPKVLKDGVETAEFSHDIVSGLGTVTIEVAAWNNWPSMTGTFKALLGEVERVTFQIE